MTRRDYLLLSRALRTARMRTPDQCEQDGIDKAAREIAQEVSELRGGFDAQRFLADSGTSNK